MRLLAAHQKSYVKYLIVRIFSLPNTEINNYRHVNEDYWNQKLEINPMFYDWMMHNDNNNIMLFFYIHAVMASFANSSIQVLSVCFSSEIIHSNRLLTAAHINNSFFWFSLTLYEQYTAPTRLCKACIFVGTATQTKRSIQWNENIGLTQRPNIN